MDEKKEHLLLQGALLLLSILVLLNGLIFVVRVSGRAEPGAFTHGLARVT